MTKRDGSVGSTLRISTAQEVLMFWWIVVIVLVLVVVGWLVTRRSRGGHADQEAVRQTRGKDEGRGFGPTAP